MEASNTIRRIALTPGEPAGIGPDLVLKLIQTPHDCQIICVADTELMRERAAQLGLPVEIKQFDADAPAVCQKAGELTILPIKMIKPAKTGLLDKENSRYVLKSIDRATRGCVEGLFSALVTGPVHKGIINDAGIAFTGHTEYIAEITGGQPVMMLATEGLRVALVTIHIPLSKVSEMITHARLRTVIRILDQDLRSRFGIANPRIVVCGLNPHAGENGHLGSEEKEIIEPVIENLRQHGLNLQGPLPADTVFTPKYLDNADAVLAMYHDQGLPVLKYKGFGKAVNITLGLPIIRTSVDHGTALDLAGTGLADESSLVYALQTALTLTPAYPSD
ncbi:4-hydroxythreonine-4-phosphate dehydrogenase PdxA [Methylicorpusculum oleiharenae]|uniref:4-hydroxythreonine-4-phosphate dehydrogenase PdxA n=1 Tax=Methylicorpusculum oleiharenae TaxID=1338687 RepID=UPI00135BCED1|nr:4-hydroxythreonine-4-phosphate dehydrogenase PdxA [Methylicorpusculum oleiharenae]MCD2452645.1 4-hydroxythreonine-4-phosphate dehydrogenase PdxA [Methylicorpusculum oleiharenae]